LDSFSSIFQRIASFRLGDQQTWSRIRKVTLGLILFQVVLFMWIYIPELKERWEEIYPLLSKAVLGVIVLIFLMWAYYRWLDKTTLIHKIVGYTSKILIIMYLLQWFFLVLFWLINPPITLTQLKNLLQGYGLKRDYVSYAQISPNMKLAVLASEDQLFTDHDGFDVKAIKIALKYNKRHPRKTHGASTISQQTAKNVFLWQGRTMIRKALEVYFTFMIETFWSKKKILERYLNVIETGPGVFGVQAAARADFNKDAKDLTRAEAAMIAACLPNPKKYTVKPIAPQIRFRYDDIMVQMNNLENDPDIQLLIGTK
jgi:monofunctional glycosyltransferase